MVGGGGREHALVDACARSASVKRVLAAPGNPGMAEQATCHAVGVEDLDGLVALARAEAVDLVVVGPEVPLALGLADRLRAEGNAVFGPGAAAAKLESSKAYAKDFMVRHDVPTAFSKTFTEESAAVAFLEVQKLPVVIKASGLAAGKGVIITGNLEEAKQTVREMLSGSAFGESGKEVVIEEFLVGEEVSVMVLVSGQSYALLSPSQDHKRVGEGDTGLNTGGMGAYAPAACFTPEVEAFVRAKVVEATLRGLARDGLDYRGCLYVGLMLTPDGPKVLEYNVRFGDPETQVLLPLVTEDVANLLAACAEGRPIPERLELADESALVVVLAAGGYPGSYAKGDVISLPEDLPENVRIYHAGTATKGGALVTNGGRVLGVVATGRNLDGAAGSAYAVCERVSFTGAYYRRDIGWRQRRDRTR